MAEQVIHSHWHQSIAGLAITPTEFYEAVGTSIMKRDIRGVTIKGEYFSEGMIGSAQRLYLRARRGEYFFDICGAPFADGSFVSWWLVEETGCMKGCLLGIPVLGWLLLVLLFRETYYKVDTRRLMFQDAIHSAVLEVVDGLTKAKGLRELAGDERRPTMQKLMKIPGEKHDAIRSVEIGAVLPLTGSAAEWGTPAKQGVLLALDEINRAGGINGVPVHVQIEDDRCDAGTGTSALLKIIATSKPAAVIGAVKN